MRRPSWTMPALVATAALVLAAAVTLPRRADAVPAAEGSPPNLATVQRGKLSAALSAAGILTYQARPDGSPSSITNQASGTYTTLPEVGDKVACGGALYRVDEKPVVLLCGPIPGYRELSSGDAGKDVQQLNRNLHQLGYDRAVGVQIGPDDQTFNATTQRALEQFQRAEGLPVTGKLQTGEVIFLATAVRIATVAAEPGGPARPGASVAQVTSDTLGVQVNLEPWQQAQVTTGAAVQIALPSNASVTGKVARIGAITKSSGAAGPGPAEASIPVFIGLDDPTKALGLDEAPVQVQITTRGVDDALSVPVTALVGRDGGGFAVEVVRDGGKQDLVAVQPGLFDTVGGRVQVEGALREGDHVVVPSV